MSAPRKDSNAKTKLVLLEQHHTESSWKKRHGYMEEKTGDKTTRCLKEAGDLETKMKENENETAKYNGNCRNRGNTTEITGCYYRSGNPNVGKGWERETLENGMRHALSVSS